MGWKRTLGIWTAFLACTLGGAGFLLSTDGTWQAVGLALLLAPVAILVFLTLAYYARERRQAER